MRTRHFEKGKKPTFVFQKSEREDSRCCPGLAASSVKTNLCQSKVIWWPDFWVSIQTHLCCKLLIPLLAQHISVCFGFPKCFPNSWCIFKVWEKKWFFFPPGDLENCICRIANNFGVLLAEHLRTFHVMQWMDSLTMWMEGVGSSKHFSSYSESLPASTNSYTFSLGSPSVTVELLGLLVWGVGQAEEISLAILPHIQESWTNRPLTWGRLTWKESDWPEFEPCLFEFQCL